MNKRYFDSWVGGFLKVLRFRNYSLRTKLIIVFITIVVSSVGIVAFLTNRSLRANLTEDVGGKLESLAKSKAIEIAQILDQETDLVTALALNGTIERAAENATATDILNPAEIEQLDREWRDADAKNNDADALVAGVLQNTIAAELNEFQDEFHEHVEIFITDQRGVNIAATNRTSDYYQADEEWWQVAYKEGNFVGQPAYDASSKTFAIIMAAAIKEEGTGKVVGVLRTTVNFDAITKSLVAGRFGKTGHTEIFLPDGQELALEAAEGGSLNIVLEEAPLNVNILAQSTEPYIEVLHDQIPALASQAGVTVQAREDEHALSISNLNWRVLVFQDKKEALQAVENQTRNILFLAFAISLVAALAALGLAQVISGPVSRLNAVAEKVASGDLSAQAVVETGDEIGALATTFNVMTTRLRELIGTLEQRVAERTKALATSAEVSRRLSTILDQRQLLVEVVEQVKSAFNYYYAQIYLLQEANGDLIMAGGTGEAGQTMLARGHKIPRGKGLVGRAAETNTPVLVPDTSKDQDWLPNQLLPDTRSEAAIPISIANQVLGVLDVQHNAADGLKQEDVDLLQSLANQVAVALQNARSYSEVQQHADREARITSIGQKIQSTTSVESALQVTIRELGRTLGVNNIEVILDAPALSADSGKTKQASS